MMFSVNLFCWAPSVDIFNFFPVFSDNHSQELVGQERVSNS